MWWFLFTLLCVSFYAEFVENFTMERKVFGGDTARPRLHKHLVKLEIFGPEVSFCSGNIISDKWIITAAHCVYDATNLTVSQDTTANRKLIAAVRSKNIHVHPKWVGEDQSYFPYDIALIKTTDAIEFNEFVRPIKLARRCPSPGQSAIIAGYGNSEGGKSKPREGIVTISRCGRWYPNAICSDGTVWAGSGDSGGPLVSEGRLVGITVAGCVDEEKQTQCETIYTSVDFHRSWIKTVMMEN